MSSACGCGSFKETPLALTLFWNFKRSQVCFMRGSCFPLPQWQPWTGSRGYDGLHVCFPWHLERFLLLLIPIWHRLCWYYSLWDCMSEMSQWLCQVENYPYINKNKTGFLTGMYYLIILSSLGVVSTWTDITERTEKWTSGRCLHALATEKQACVNHTHSVEKTMNPQVFVLWFGGGAGLN